MNRLCATFALLALWAATASGQAPAARPAMPATVKPAMDQRSIARTKDALPPAPIGLTISYGLVLVPEESDTFPPRECSNCMRGQEIGEGMVCVTLTTILYRVPGSKEGEV